MGFKIMNIKGLFSKKKITYLAEVEINYIQYTYIEKLLKF